MPSSEDFDAYLSKDVEHLDLDEIENALCLVLNSYKYYNKYEEAVCIKALVHATRNKKLAKLKNVCLNYLREEDPQTKKLVDEHVEQNAKYSGISDDQFLRNLGISSGGTSNT